MKLSPQIIQAMEILQLPLQALEERIEEELTANPVLELREHAAEDAPGSEGPEVPASDRGEETMVVGSEDTDKDFERLDDFDDTYSEQFEWSERPSRGGADSGERDAKMDALANTPAPDQNLAEFLLEQWAFVETSEPVKEAGETIINALDADG
jgi:RNA polymerase sigma-54 factor